MNTINKTIANKDLSILVNDLSPIWGITVPGTHQFLKNNDYQSAVVGSRAYLPSGEVRKAMEARGLTFSKNIISVHMLKGGVGKTSIALNVGIRASMYGAKVLLVDLDQQANLSFAFDITDENTEVWADILESRRSISDLICVYSESLHIIPSNLNNSVLDKIILNGKRNVATAVSQYLGPIQANYDLIIIDTAPNLSAINTAAACASNIVLLPVTPDKFSFDGLRKTINDLDQIKREFASEFEKRVVFNKFDARETSSHQLLKLCFADYSDIMLNSFIRISSEIKNTIRTGTTVFSKKGTAKEDYDTMTRELLGFASN